MVPHPFCTLFAGPTNLSNAASHGSSRGSITLKMYVSVAHFVGWILAKLVTDPQFPNLSEAEKHHNAILRLFCGYISPPGRWEVGYTWICVCFFSSKNS